MIDPAARQRLVMRFGPWANEWCDELPARIDRISRRWGITIGHPVSRGSTSCVLFCERSGGRLAVLKLSPDPGLISEEAAALRAWQSSGRVPEVLGYDEENGALLLEAIQPGTVLADTQIAPHLDEVAGLVRDLHATGEEAIEDFPSLIEGVEFMFTFYRERLRRHDISSPVLEDLLERSLVVAREMAARPGRRVLLHGDLHARNVLDAGEDRGLVAIDPRACVGDPAFDLIDWVLYDSLDRRTLMRRAERLSGRAGVDSSNLWRWCGCTAVLVAISQLIRSDVPTEATRTLLAFADDAV
jgi:streptomycin 6-kinase